MEGHTIEKAQRCELACNLTFLSLVLQWFLLNLEFCECVLLRSKN